MSNDSVNFLKQSLLKEVLVSPAITIFVDDPFSAVEAKLRFHKIRHLPVIDRHNKLVGIVTQRDLYHTLAPRRTEDGDYYDKTALDSFVLKYIMTPNPLALKPDDTVARIIEIFATHKYGCIPIVKEDGALLGIVTQVDILKFIVRWLKTS